MRRPEEDDATGSVSNVSVVLPNARLDKCLDRAFSLLHVDKALQYFANLPPLRQDHRNCVQQTVGVETACRHVSKLLSQAI